MVLPKVAATKKQVYVKKQIDVELFLKTKCHAAIATLTV